MKSIPLEYGVHDLGEATLVSISKRGPTSSWARFADWSQGVAVFTDRFEKAFDVQVVDGKNGLPMPMPEKVTGVLVVEVKKNEFSGMPVAWVKSFGGYVVEASGKGRPSSYTSGPAKGNAEANVIARVLAACIEAGTTKETAVEWVDLGLAKLKESVR